jgi:prepilin-type N-terminal cleavage/methylation domain-containing protein
MNFRRNHCKISAQWSQSGGFTLVELMVAIVVMALILIIMTQISTGTMQATNRVTQQIEGGEGAGAVFSSLRADLSNLDTAQGMTIFASQSGANDDTVLAFVTESRGPQPTGGISSYRFVSVAYELNSATGELQRYTLPIQWNDQGMVPDAVNTIANATTAPSVLAQGVLRFQAVAVLDNGNIVPLSATTQPSASNWINASSTSGNPNGYIALNLSYTGTTTITGTPIYMNRVQAIIVGLAVMDPNNFNLLNSLSPDLTTAESVFPAPPTTQSATSWTSANPWVVNATPLDAWEPFLWSTGSGSLSSLGLPKPASASIQVFQNTFWLQNPVKPPTQPN